MSAWATMRAGKQTTAEDHMPFLVQTLAPGDMDGDMGWNALMRYMGGEDPPEGHGFQS